MVDSDLNQTMVFVQDLSRLFVEVLHNDNMREKCLKIAKSEKSDLLAIVAKCLAARYLSDQSEAEFIKKFKDF